MPAATSRASRFLYLGLAAVLLGVDQVTKAAARAKLRLADVDVVPHFLKLVLTENRDVAFGLMRWIPEKARLPVIIAFGIGASIAIAWVVVRKPTPTLERFLWTLVLAGALGNVTDRLTQHGAVTDFILAYVKQYQWPVFNVADSFITVGVLSLLAFGRAKEKPPAKAEEKPA